MAWQRHVRIVVAAVGIGTVAAVYFTLEEGRQSKTRLAGTPLPLALELCLSDPMRLAAAVEEVSRELADVAALLKREHRTGFESFLHDAAHARADIARSPLAPDPKRS